MKKQNQFIAKPAALTAGDRAHFVLGAPKDDNNTLKVRQRVGEEAATPSAFFSSTNLYDQPSVVNDVLSGELQRQYQRHQFSGSFPNESYYPMTDCLLESNSATLGDSCYGEEGSERHLLRLINARSNSVNVYDQSERPRYILPKDVRFTQNALDYSGQLFNVQQDSTTAGTAPRGSQSSAMKYTPLLSSCSPVVDQSGSRLSPSFSSGNERWAKSTEQHLLGDPTASALLRPAVNNAVLPDAVPFDVPFGPQMVNNNFVRSDKSFCFFSENEVRNILEHSGGEPFFNRTPAPVEMSPKMTRFPGGIYSNAVDQRLGAELCDLLLGQTALSHIGTSVGDPAQTPLPDALLCSKRNKAVQDTAKNGTIISASAFSPRINTVALNNGFCDSSKERQQDTFQEFCFLPSYATATIPVTSLSSEPKEQKDFSFNDYFCLFNHRAVSQDSTEPVCCDQTLEVVASCSDTPRQNTTHTSPRARSSYPVESLLAADVPLKPPPSNLYPSRSMPRPCCNEDAFSFSRSTVSDSRVFAVDAMQSFTQDHQQFLCSLLQKKSPKRKEPVFSQCGSVTSLDASASELKPTSARTEALSASPRSCLVSPLRVTLEAKSNKTASLASASVTTRLQDPVSCGQTSSDCRADSACDIVEMDEQKRKQLHQVRQRIAPLPKEQLVELLAWACVEHTNVACRVESVVLRSPSCRRLMVRNIAFQATDAEFRNFMGQFGALEDCVVVREADQASRGFGFVTYAKLQDVEDLLARPSSSLVFYNRQLFVKLASDPFAEFADATAPSPFRTSSALDGTNNKHEPFCRRELFIRNLPYDLTEAGLRALLAQDGDVEHCRVVRNERTGVAFAFVRFSSWEAAVKAVQQPQRNLGDRSVFLSFALKKTAAGRRHRRLKPLSLLPSTASLTNYSHLNHLPGHAELN